MHTLFYFSSLQIYRSLRQFNYPDFQIMKYSNLHITDTYIRNSTAQMQIERPKTKITSFPCTRPKKHELTPCGKKLCKTCIPAYMVFLPDWQHGRAGLEAQLAQIKRCLQRGLLRSGCSDRIIAPASKLLFSRARDGSQPAACLHHF